MFYDLRKLVRPMHKNYVYKFNQTVRRLICDVRPRIRKKNYYMPLEKAFKHEILIELEIKCLYLEYKITLIWLSYTLVKSSKDIYNNAIFCLDMKSKLN